ncbi:MAG: adenosylcobinamide-GDP ribazoletransferase [Glaciimonas sp.]|nr:adenosylcobinamide-GDP ribazoletransferase [Glaciimonas sp.]
MNRCLHQLRLFFIALQFFTRIPIPRWVGFESAWLQHAVRYFPSVGWVVAAVTAAVYALSALLWPQAVAVLLSTSAGIYLTGAFHEDGFADVCDGFGGGLTQQRVLEIMQDSRVGAYGAIGIALLLAFKCVLLSSLPGASVVIALLLGHTLSRLLATTLIWQLQYAKVEGKAKPLAQQMSSAEFLIAALTVALPTAIVLGLGWIAWQGLLAGAICATLATAFLARKFVQRIGGYTGDCLGAVQQVAEVAFYLGLLAVMA